VQCQTVRVVPEEVHPGKCQAQSILMQHVELWVCSLMTCNSPKVPSCIPAGRPSIATSYVHDQQSGTLCPAVALICKRTSEDNGFMTSTALDARLSTDSKLIVFVGRYEDRTGQRNSRTGRLEKCITLMITIHEASCCRYVAPAAWSL
jgi:hypothetical protein